MEKNRIKSRAVFLRFYEELNDFLPPHKRKIRFEHNYSGTPSVKDLIESLGVPHTEVDLILVNGQSATFKYKLNNGDDISVYPEFESMDITPLQKLRPAPLRRPRFILDVHLGSLARYMRMLGIDTLYRNDYPDEEIIEISVSGKRAILTRDLGILKNGTVKRGYFVRNTEPVKQIEEVINRFDLARNIKEFSRCVKCNSRLRKIKKETIIDILSPKVKQQRNEFTFCPFCGKVYWKGTHYEKMKKLINSLKHSAEL